MAHQSDIPNGSYGYFPSPYDLFPWKPKAFSPVEKELFKLLLAQYMGTEPADDSWTVSIDAYDAHICWLCEYSIDGYNYCSEDEYSISLDLSVGDIPPQESQYRKISDPEGLLYLHATEPYLDGLYLLVQYLFPHAGTVWVKDNGRYDDPRNPLRHVSADAELLFEDLFQTGKTVLLHFVDARLAPF